jgi:hypothetical protein
MDSPTKNNNSFKSMTFGTRALRPFSSEMSITRQMEMAGKLGALASQPQKDLTPKEHLKKPLEVLVSDETTPPGHLFGRGRRARVNKEINAFSKDSYEKTVIRERNYFIEEHFGKELVHHFKCLEHEASLIKKCFYEAQFTIPNHFDSAKIEQMLCAYFENLGYKTKVNITSQRDFRLENSPDSQRDSSGTLAFGSAGGIDYNTKKKSVPPIRDLKVESEDKIISINLS